MVGLVWSIVGITLGVQAVVIIRSRVWRPPAPGTPKSHVWVFVVRQGKRAGAVATTVEHLRGPAHVVMVAGTPEPGVRADVWLPNGDIDDITRAALGWIREQSLVDRALVAMIDAGSLPVPGQFEAIERHFANPSVGAVEFGARPRRVGSSWLARVANLDLTTVQPAYQALRDEMGVLGLRSHRVVRASAWRDVLLRATAPWSELGPALIQAGWRVRQHVFAAVEVDGMCRLNSLWRARRREAAETLRAGRQVRAVWGSGVSDAAAWGALGVLARPWLASMGLVLGMAAVFTALGAIAGLWGSAATGSSLLLALGALVVAPGTVWGVVEARRVGDRSLVACLSAGAGLGVLRAIEASAALAAVVSGRGARVDAPTSDHRVTRQGEPATPALGRRAAALAPTRRPSAPRTDVDANASAPPPGRAFKMSALPSDDAGEQRRALGSRAATASVPTRGQRPPGRRFRDSDENQSPGTETCVRPQIREGVAPFAHVSTEVG